MDKRKAYENITTGEKKEENPLEWGNLSEDELADATLMVHPGKGLHWIPNGEVERKLRFGYVRLEKAETPEPPKQPEKGKQK